MLSIDDTDADHAVFVLRIGACYLLHWRAVRAASDGKNGEVVQDLLMSVSLSGLWAKPACVAPGVVFLLAGSVDKAAD